MIDFTQVPVLVYSSHKTATQTIVRTFHQNGVAARHCHVLDDCKHWSTSPIDRDNFLHVLRQYKAVTGRKLIILSVVRPPQHRLLSSFFQSFSTDEMHDLGRREEDTTVARHSERELCAMYADTVIHNTGTPLHPCYMESLDELSCALGIHVLELLEKRKDHYRYTAHPLFDLFVLDFERVIQTAELSVYLQSVVGIPVDRAWKANVSADKSYYDKYMAVKRMVGGSLDGAVRAQYNPFYFQAFSKESS